MCSSDLLDLFCARAPYSKLANAVADRFGGIADAVTIRTRSRELAALVRANQRAVDALRTNPAARRLVAERGRLSAAGLEQQLAGMELPELASQPSRFAPGGTVHVATSEAVRALRRYGAISREPAPAELLEEGILRAANSVR